MPHSAKTKISAALAVHNEEGNIVDCLESLQKFADEIIVVDGNSSDRTSQLASKLGAIVIKKPNQQMFNINKNIAIKKCKNSWIFLIDADERVSDELAKEINKIAISNPQENGFWVNRKNWFLGGFLLKGGVYPDPVIRLFKKGKGQLPEIDLHEQVEITGKVGKLNEDLLHFADPNFRRYLERADRYTSSTSVNIQKAHVPKNSFSLIYYFFVKPIYTFVNIFIRHKGYQDGFRGFVWALFSAAHFFYAYTKYWSGKNE